MTEPLDIAAIESHPRDAPHSINRALDERDALLAEVKRLRAQVADDLVSRSEYAFRTGLCPDCGQPTQPEEY